jgi:hypothetical protein
MAKVSVGPSALMTIFGKLEGVIGFFFLDFVGFYNSALDL